MIELVIGVLVALSTLFLCLSVDVALRKSRRNDPWPTNVDVDLTGYDVASEDVDLNLRGPGGKEPSALGESDLIRENPTVAVTKLDFDFRELEEASRKPPSSS